MNREIATKTLAQLYLRQGDSQKALEIYLKVLEREPQNAEIRETVEYLKRKTKQAPPIMSNGQSEEDTKKEQIRSLERWREGIRIIRDQRKNGDED